MKKSIPLILILSILISTFSGAAIAQDNRLTLVGSWEGSTAIGTDEITMAFTLAVSNGEYTATLINTNMGVYGMPVDIIEINGLNMIMRIERIDVEFLGRLRLNDVGDTVLRIDGDWYQRSEMTPVVLLPVAQPSL